MIRLYSKYVFKIYQKTTYGLFSVSFILWSDAYYVNLFFLPAEVKVLISTNVFAKVKA